MFSLLLLLFALSTSAAAQTAVGSSDPLLMSAPPVVGIESDAPIIIGDGTAKSFDAMEIHPDSDICYKIRAFIFSQGPHPKLLRETTCGPKAPAARQTEGFKPQLVPLDVKDKPASEK
jgi:hypothetical protein